MTKKRQAIFDKFGGLCAYTGKPLGADWQVDHQEPLFYCNMYIRDPDRPENLFPSLKIVNHYKRSLTLEQFRLYMISFHLRLQKLPHNPRVAKSTKRKDYMLKVAEAFGITVDKPFNGKFYFETLSKTNDTGTEG